MRQSDDGHEHVINSVDFFIRFFCRHMYITRIWICDCIFFNQCISDYIQMQCNITHKVNTIVWCLCLSISRCKRLKCQIQIDCWHNLQSTHRRIHTHTFCMVTLSVTFVDSCNNIVIFFRSSFVRTNLFQINCRELIFKEIFLVF